MSKKVKLQDLSISNFDQQPDVSGIKGGSYYIKIPCYKKWCGYIGSVLECKMKPGICWIRIG